MYHQRVLERNAVGPGIYGFDIYVYDIKGRIGSIFGKAITMVAVTGIIERHRIAIHEFLIPFV